MGRSGQSGRVCGHHGYPPFHHQISPPLTPSQQVIGIQDNFTPTNPFTTTTTNELVVVFVSAYGVTPASETDTLTGAGVTWTLAVRTNAQFGMASIWWAVIPSIVTSQVLTSTRSQKAARGGLISIEGFTGQDTVTPIGATGTGRGTVTAETVSLTTTKNNSWVYGVGSDVTNNAARTVGGSQSIVDQQIQALQSNTFWSQTSIGE